jgi:hypothetical protein
MKRLIHFVAKLYPRTWRERYGAEFEALLDDAFLDGAGADGRMAFDVLTGAIVMQVRSWKRIGAAALLGVAALFVASWWVGQKLYISPGTGQVIRMDSNAGAMIGFLVILAAIAGGLATAILHQDGKIRAAARAGWATAGGLVVYLAAVAVVALVTPRTIVSVGDGYCYDLWCIGVQKVNATPQGENILYTAEVRIFSDANRVTAHENDFLYALDDQGRRFPLRPDSSSVPVEDITVRPGESAKTTLTFLAPKNAGKLYLAGERLEMPWVYLYFGSDVSPFHRRTLLRVL